MAPPPESPWQALQDERPLAARLALLSCLPVRVTPAFLRLARLRLVAEAGTGDEADLWLSDLVETRSSAGLSYRRAVRDTLRQHLAADPRLLDAVWTQVHLEHAPWLAPRGRLEEELTWRLLRDPEDAWIAACWRAVLGELDTGPNAEGVARWVVRAVPDLPPGTLDVESGRRAYYGANLLLGDASVLGNEAQSFLDSDRFAFATRRLPRRRIHVGRVEGGLLVSPLSPIENGFELDIPATQPLWLQVEAGPTGARLDPRVITLADNEPVTCQTGLDTVNVRLIDGSAYAIGPMQPSSRQARASNRPPRVQIEYDVELYGTEKKIQLPFVMGVMAGLSGKPSQPLPPVADRKFVGIDVDNFDARMKSMKPRVAFHVPDLLAGEGDSMVDLTFESLDDFSPAAVAARVEGLRPQFEARQRLADLSARIASRASAEELLTEVMQDEPLLRSLAGAPSRPAEAGPGPTRRRTSKAEEASTVEAHTLDGIQFQGRAFAPLLAKAFEPRTGEARLAIEQAVRTLAQQALADTTLVSRDPTRSIGAMIAAIDQKLSRPVNAVLHQPEFQALEGAWRGLHHLVKHTETDEMLKIRVMNISKAELGKAFKGFSSTNWDQSPIFKKIHEEEFGQLGGEPYDCLIGDYFFDHSLPDVEMLGQMAKVAAASLAPFIAAASPTLMHMASWQELANPRDLTKIFETSEYAAWRSLRESEDARYLALTMPRFLSRLPYGAKTHPVEAFDFEEETSGGDRGLYTWSNAAYAMAANIARSFKLYGWCSRISGVEGGGAVEGLPSHVFPSDDGSVDMKCPTEIAISDRREAELAKSGFMPLVHRKNSDIAAFIGAHSLQRPIEYDDPDATANANLAARLPYVFACSRFTHYLKCIVRDRVGSFRQRADMEKWLNDWILNYVDGDPARSSEATKAQRPLAAAEVVVEEVPEDPGYYTGQFYLRPHYQLEGLTVSLRVTARLPSVAGPA